MSDRIKVLIVDDEAGFARLLKMNLDEAGLYDVKIENSGEKGLKTARRFRPDVLLMDVTMSDMSGFEVAAELWADAELKKIPIIFVTATPPSGVDEGSAGQVFEYISKPASAQDIIECVKRCTANRGENRP